MSEIVVRCACGAVYAFPVEPLRPGETRPCAGLPSRAADSDASPEPGGDASLGAGADASPGSFDDIDLGGEG